MRTDSPPMINKVFINGKYGGYQCRLVEATGCRLLRVGEYLLCCVSVPRPLHRVLRLHSDVIVVAINL